MPAYKRILLKLSGEALMGDDAYGINRATIVRMVREVQDITQMGCEVAVVIGQNRVRRLKPRVMLLLASDKSPNAYPPIIDLLYDPPTPTASSWPRIRRMAWRRSQAQPISRPSGDPAAMARTAARQAADNVRTIGSPVLACVHDTASPARFSPVNRIRSENRPPVS